MSVQIDSMIIDSGEIGQDRRIEIAICMSIMIEAHIGDIITTEYQKPEGDAILMLTIYAITIDRYIGNIQTEVAMKITEVFKILIEVIIITMEVEVLQIIDFNRGQVINDITRIETDPIVINTGSWKTTIQL